jgi:two-component sensor histidine kinase
MFRDPAITIELLNRVGQELGAACASAGGRGPLISRVRAILQFDGVSLWTVRRDVPAREYVDWGTAAPQGWETVDEGLAHDRLTKGGHAFAASVGAIPPVLSIALAGSDDRIVGALQLYGASPYSGPRLEQGEHFLRSLSGMMGQFVERRQLELGATLLREVHHRVKNNLHTVASMLRMQLRRLDHVEPGRAIEESISRIQAIAQVHESLSRSQDGQVELLTLGREIAGPMEISLQTRGDPLWVDAQKASPLALILNELLQNAADHGKGDGSVAAVRLQTVKEGERAHVVVTDNGPGWPAQFDRSSLSTLGLTIVELLVDEELFGTLDFRNDGGAAVELTFPLP